MPYTDTKSEAARASHSAAQIRWRATKGADYEAARTARKQQRKVDYVTALKVGAVCSYCGAEGDLHFHHRDPSTKLFPIAHSRVRSWAKIFVEVAKCDLICVPCHQGEHAHR